MSSRNVWLDSLSDGIEIAGEVAGEIAGEILGPCYILVIFAVIVWIVAKKLIAL